MSRGKCKKIPKKTEINAGLEVISLVRER